MAEKNDIHYGQYYNPHICMKKVPEKSLFAYLGTFSRRVLKNIWAELKDVTD